METDSIDRLRCGYLYHSRHWVGKSTGSLNPCCPIKEVYCSCMVHVFESLSPFPFWSNTWRKRLEMIYGKWSVQAPSKHAHAWPQLSDASCRACSGLLQSLLLSCDEWAIIKSYCLSVQNEHSKSKCSSGSPLLKTLEVESQRYTMTCLVGKALTIDNPSALVAYLKCHD